MHARDVQGDAGPITKYSSGNPIPLSYYSVLNSTLPRDTDVKRLLRQIFGFPPVNWVRDMETLIFFFFFFYIDYLQ